MFIQIIIVCLIGMACGMITGLIPGLHVNTIAALMIACALPLTQILPPLLIGLLILAMGLTHTFIDVIPSTFLGIPDASTYLLLLPAHRFVLEGKGVVAVRTAIRGSFLSLLVCLSFVPLIVLNLDSFLRWFKHWIPFVLIGVIVIIVLRQQTFKKKLLAFLFYCMSGFLGFLCFTNEIISEPLLPLLTGFFGVSGVIMSIHEQTTIPYQYPHERIPLPPLTECVQTIKAFLSGGLTGVLPGLSSSQAALIDALSLSRFWKGKRRKEKLLSTEESTSLSYLFLIGGINTVNFVFSIVVLYVMSSARNGAIIAVRQFVPAWNQNTFLIALFCVLCIGSGAVLIGLHLMVPFSRLIREVSYTTINYGLLLFLLIIVVMLSGWIGLLVLMISTSIGLLCHRYAIPKTTLMGCILLPVLLYIW